MRPGRIVLRRGQRTWDAEVNGDGSVEIGGERLQLHADDPGAWIVELDGRRRRVYVATDGDALWVHDEGRVHVLEAGGAAARLRRRSASSEELSAPMPATVRAVLVSPGDAVRAGQPLITLEAMKMELSIRAPGDGIVAAVLCNPGDLVQPGVALVELT